MKIVHDYAERLAPVSEPSDAESLRNAFKYKLLQHDGYASVVH